MKLDLTLKTVAIVFLAAAGYEFLADDRIALTDVVVANIFFVLSIFARGHARRISVISLGLAFVVPIGTIRTYLDGENNVLTVTAHVGACGYLAFIAYRTFRAEAEALLERARRGGTAEPEAEEDNAR